MLLRGRLAVGRPWSLRTVRRPALWARCLSSPGNPGNPGSHGGHVLRDDKGRLFDMLHLKTFSRDELLASLEELRVNPQAAALAKQLGLRWAEGEEEQYVQDVRAMAERLDPRVWPIAVSFLFAGISIGAIIPILPVLAHSMSITSLTYSAVVSSFALTRLVGNVQASTWSDSLGRKRTMIVGLGVCSVAIACVGVTPTLTAWGTVAAASWLIACRSLSGFGVGMFQTSSLILLSNDLANPLNRTRTLAPPSSFFQAGMSVGPLLGGVSVQYVGLSSTYLAVGGSLALLALINRVLIPETHIVAPAAVAARSSAVRRSLSTWSSLLVDARVRKLVAFQFIYWSCLAGIQFTLLPLELVKWGFTAQELGICFATVSAVSFATAQPFAKLADHKGKVLAMSIGAVGIACTFFALPWMQTFHHMLGAAVGMGISQTLLGATPVSLISDYCSDKDRAQAVSLIRTAQDLGFLFGAVLSGALSAAVADTGILMQGAGGVMTCALWLLFRLRGSKRKP